MIKRNLVFKLTIGYISIVLISTLIIGALFINMFKNYTLNKMEKNLLQKANEISNTVEPYLSSSRDLTKYSQVFKLIESCVNAKVWIAGKDGTMLVKSNDSPEGNTKDSSYNVNQYDKEFVKQILNGQTVVRNEYNNFYNEPMLSAGVPIQNSSNIVTGMVILHSSLSNVTSIINRVFNILLVVILLEIILSGMLGFYFSRFITKPLKIMNQSAIEMTNGNYKVRTDIYQNDEIGELSNSLDMLALKLEYTINQLFEEKNKLNDLFLSMSEGILAFDLKMKLISYNSPAQKLLGVNETALNSHSCEKNVTWNELLSEFESTVIDGQKKLLIKTINNNILRFSISPVKNNLNEITGAVVLIQDISEQEKLEQMRKDFIANVSHEFRTPLTLIKGSLESLIDGAVPYNNIKDTYNSLLDETNRLQRMVNDLLDLSKLQSRKVSLNFEELDLTSLISDTSRTMQFIASKKNIKIELSLEKDMPPIWGDYDKLKQLLIIFIDNAIKYSYEGSKIEISTDINNYANINIIDNGIGIPKEDIPYIWDRFYKVDKSRDNSKAGTGLGLAIAKHLISILNCAVNVESELHKGTKIRIGLPLSKEAAI